MNSVSFRSVFSATYRFYCMSELNIHQVCIFRYSWAYQLIVRAVITTGDGFELRLCVHRRSGNRLPF